MNRICAFARLMVLIFGINSFAHAEPLQSQESTQKHFLERLSNEFQIDPKKECPKLVTRFSHDLLHTWREETHIAISQGREPDYIRYVHCAISRYSRHVLKKYRPFHSDEASKFELYSLILIHSFHSAIYDKSRELTRNGMKLFQNIAVKPSSFGVSNFDYLGVSHDIIERIERGFDSKYPPRISILSRVRAMRVFLNNDLLEQVLGEARRKYPPEHPVRQNPELMTQAMFRIAERIVLIKFTRNIDSIFKVMYQSLNNQCILKEEFQLYSQSFEDFVVNRINSRLNKTDRQNITFLFLEFLSANLENSAVAGDLH